MFRNKFTLVVVVLVLVLLVPMVAAQDETEAQTPEAICEAATPASDPENREYDQAENVLEVGVDYYAIFCTEVGPVYVDLFETMTPVTVNNFVFLAENDFYNNTTFHRVIENFMAQGGDPGGTGSGGPGYRFEDEFLPFLVFDRVGLLAMANAGPNTNGSQFFLTTFITDWLNNPETGFPNHTVFGDVIYGQNVVDAIPATEEGEPAALNSVVIVTDPGTVDVGDLPREDEAVSQEIFESRISNFPELPESLTLSEDSGILDTNTVAALAGEAEADIASLLTENHHQFSAVARIQNATCDFDAAGFAQAGVTIHVFGSREDVQAIVSSGSVGLLATLGKEGFELVEADSLLVPVYSGSADACDQPGKMGYMVRWLGRFVIISDVLVSEDSAPVEQWLNEVINPRIFDLVFGRELRDR